MRNCNESRIVVGNSVDINLRDRVICNSAEIRADISVDEFNGKRVWGQVKNCRGEGVANSIAKLVKVVCNQYGQEEFIGIAHTITDCQGFYQFDICGDDLSCYKILISKPTVGIEAVIINDGGNCNPCQGGGCGNGNGQYNPCCGQEVVYVNNPSTCGCDYDESNWCKNPYDKKNRVGCSNNKFRYR